MILVFYAVQIFLLGVLSLQDWQSKRISIFWLALFVLLTVMGLGDFRFPVHFEMVGAVLGFLIFVKVTALFGFGKTVIGNGDLVLLLPLLMSLHIEELSLFLITAGLGGIITTRILKERRVPFVPALSFAYLLVLVMRHAVT